MCGYLTSDRYKLNIGSSLIKVHWIVAESESLGNKKVQFTRDYTG